VAKAGVRGRPIEPLVLSPQERAYLERQVRRHRVARSLSERCRAILRCADGSPSKSVAVELGIHEHTVGKWRHADELPGLAHAGWAFTVETATQAIRLVLSKVFEAYPKPRFIVGHLGEALPFLLWRIDLF